MGGVAHHMPVPAGLFLAGCHSISAIPPFSDLATEWLTFQAFLQASLLGGGDIAAVCNDVAFPFAYQQLERVVDNWRRIDAGAFGHRLIEDTPVPGGVVRGCPTTPKVLMNATIVLLGGRADDGAGR